ncbi:MAG: amidohydrolase [Alphaproteobacteria bacterium]|nr:MAG: amidohydrolase [Alphaproteobacteria bacterium]
MERLAFVNDEVDRLAPGCCELSDAIWELAEPVYGELASADLHLSALVCAGFRITRGVADIPTAFIAEWGDAGPVIAMLGEYDALAGLSQEHGTLFPQPAVDAQNGNGHGCGHHLLGTASNAAAIATARFLEATGRSGRVRFYGCPAEEGGGGKTFMVRAGAFDDVDAAISWHPSTRTATMSTSCLAMISASFRFEGRSAHASSTPHLGRSALDALELMNVGVQFLREHMPPDARVHYAITDAGGASPNVVQASAAAAYLVRSAQVGEATAVYERVRRIAEGAALMTDTRCMAEFDTATSNVIHNATLGAVLDRNLQTLGAPAFDASDQALATDLAATLPEEARLAGMHSAGLDADGPALSGRVLPYDPNDRTFFAGSTDVGDVSWVVPTVQCWVACYPVGTVAHSWQWVSAGRTQAAHKGMLLAARAMAGTACDLFEQPETLTIAKAELERRRGGHAYKCPIPADVQPPVSARL